jgi:endogenous inhibitor of DNA gyrase (YacG/DUF329 family)
MTPEEPVEVYSAQDLAEAQFVHNMLAEAGIKAEIVGEALGGVLGDVSSINMSPGIWVRAEDEGQARPLIEFYQQRLIERAEGGITEPLVTIPFCYHCGQEVVRGQSPCPACGKDLDWNNATENAEAEDVEEVWSSDRSRIGWVDAISGRDAMMPGDPVEVYGAHDVAEAQLVHDLLAEAGIESEIVREAQTHAAQWNTFSPGIWVRRDDEARARPLIAQHRKRLMERGEGKITEPLVKEPFCYHCGEEIARGQSPCPSCGKDLDWESTEEWVLEAPDEFW